MPSLLTSPPDVLTHIAFHLGVLDPLGPPSDLLPLFLTCRHLYNNISVNNAPHLYRALFRATFDYRAPVRRLGPKAEHTSSVVCQLRKYCEALKVIRRGDISIPIQDMTEVFWDAFFMASESWNFSTSPWSCFTLSCSSRFFLSSSFSTSTNVANGDLGGSLF